MSSILPPASQMVITQFQHGSSALGDASQMAFRPLKAVDVMVLSDVFGGHPNDNDDGDFTMGSPGDPMGIHWGRREVGVMGHFDDVLESDRRVAEARMACWILGRSGMMWL